MADIAASETRLAFVARVLGHSFSDPELLLLACTHASCLGPLANPAQRRAASNERLEFLGDAVLGAVVARMLYRQHPEADEGWLTRAKSALVSRAQLARACDRLGLLPHAVLGSQVGDAVPESVKANLVEAVIGAIFLDGGWDAACLAVERMLGEALADPGLGALDPRMALQELSLARAGTLPHYACERSGGSPHAPEYTATVTVAGRSARGQGPSRKKAEAAAAANWLASYREAPLPGG
ncbi:MAG: ribonuclease III [Planctomycetota bacterium]|nr:ribonuclease III [Planctomycetota bacterium]MCX8040215.1 ribonuclease III [Planctomycetota bacterium]MDW8372490.1 ribonuclease III [Planctomycetota bacterium]